MEYARVPEPPAQSLDTTVAHDPAASLARALDRALAQEPELAARLARSRTSVRFEVADGRTAGPARSVTLLLDRNPPLVRDGTDEPGEITLTLTARQAAQLAAGELPLAPAIYAGTVGARGPARRLMESAPILQTALAGGDAPRRATRIAAVHAPPTADPDPGLLAIHASGLAKAFGDQPVLEDVHLRIPDGCISVVLGPSGSGKSVLFQHLIGALQPDAGEVRIRGASLSGMRRSRLMELRREVGVMYQDGALFSAMNVFDNVAFPLREHTDLSDREVREVVETRLADVGLADSARAYPRELSGGMRKRAGLARALVLDPGILLCDEPDSGLDPVRAALVGDLLADHHARGGGVVLVVTHDITLARQIADHVSVLWQGKIVASGLAEDVFASDDAFVRQFLEGRIDGPLGMG